MSNTLLICDKPNKYSKEYNFVAYWDSFNESNGAYSLPKMVETDSEYFRKKYLDWLYKIGREKLNTKSVIDHLMIRADFSFWWMTLIIEKSQWKSISLYKTFRLLALERLLEKQDIDKIKIEITDIRVSKSIIQWCLDNNVRYKVSPFKNPFISFPIINFLSHFFSAIILFLKYLNDRWPIRNSKHKLNESSSNNISFI